MIRLVYSDIALGAADNATIEATGANSFSVPEKLPAGVNTGAVATCETNGWGLSHDFKVKGSQPFAFWSSAKSGADCVFASPPRIVIDFTEQFTATGLALRFSPGAGEFCRKITVGWFQGDTMKSGGVYYPNSGSYALENTVEAFDRVIISLDETNLPERRAKLEYIGIGIVREFDGEELTEATFINEVNLISDTVPVNTLDAHFHSTTDTEYLFQKKQPVEAFDGEKLIGVYYIESGEQTGARSYSIKCQDAVGTLELDTYKGGLWLEDTPAADILADIIGGGFELDIPEELATKPLRGFIPPDGTKRAAVQLVAFALGACVDTTGTAKIKMFLPATGEGAEIPPQETYEGGKVTTEDMVTEVNVTGYEITDEDPGENDEYIEYGKLQYKCIPTVYSARNPNTTAGALENKVEFSECYFINSTNAQERADAILAHYMRRKTYNFAHVLSGQNLAGRAVASLPWGGTAGGNIKKMKISVSGLTVSDTELLLD